MKITVRNLEPTKVRLTVTVDAEEFEPYLQEARKEIGKQVSIPGFRKGHVPARVLDRRVGFGAVAAEALNNGVPDLYNKAIEERDLRPMDQPKLDVKETPESADDDTKVKFTAEVEVRPKIELPSFDGVKVEVAQPAVTDEDVEQRLQNLRQRFGTLVGVDRPAAKGDFANIDLEATVNGESVDAQQGVSYELGSGTMLDGLDEALDGLSAGEETTFTSKLEGGDHQGEEAEVKVKVNSVKAEELPELNDDFAQDASEFDTLEELKADIRKACERDAEGRQATDARDAFIAFLQDNVEEIPLPKGILERSVEDHLKGLTPDPEKADDDTKEQAREGAEKELRDQITLDTLAETMKVEVSQADVMNFLASIAQQYGMDPNQFISSIIQSGQIASAVQEVARSKGLLAGMRAVEFVDPEGNTLDLSKFLGEDDNEADDEDASVAAASVAAQVADAAAQADAE
ncbi:trigger factor [Galliscardovia ingluviei]|uniref:Trigger factor n=1 Tax=Galliscardovia ingluviei TaxID=1769422 RepID=A0A8J3AG67_9BIFI|nr:trigger factor [Galliscardovia ingluviei]GGI13274.1 trigger factor [Galliscardovia ingluviei]